MRQQLTNRVYELLGEIEEDRELVRLTSWLANRTISSITAAVHSIMHTLDALEHVPEASTEFDGGMDTIVFQERDGTTRRIVFEEGDREVGLAPCWRPDDYAWTTLKRRFIAQVMGLAGQDIERENIESFDKS